MIYRHQVLKQSDVVLAQVLLSSEFTTAEKKRNFDYYDPLTTGDSSLSPCIQSVAAAELGYADAAYRYFMQTARMDLDDVNGNVAHGVHVAAMAGSWVSLVYGFAGLRDDDGSIAFSPRLPAAWNRLAFRLLVGGTTLAVTITRHAVRYEAGRGDELDIRHFGRPVPSRPARRSRSVSTRRSQAVIFDLDGVITDTAEHHYRAWQRLAAEESLPFDRELNERLKGVSRMESLDIILENAGHTASLPDKVRLADRKNAYFRELIDAITPADLLPGIGELLADLRARGDPHRDRVDEPQRLRRRPPPGIEDLSTRSSTRRRSSRASPTRRSSSRPPSGWACGSRTAWGSRTPGPASGDQGGAHGGRRRRRRPAGRDWLVSDTRSADVRGARGAVPRGGGQPPAIAGSSSTVSVGRAASRGPAGAGRRSRSRTRSRSG